MRLPRVRFTVRRMMVAVAVVAITIACCIQAGRWVRYATALREYERFRAYYEEGRITLVPSVEKSRRLMDAHLALCLTRKWQAAAITAHVERTSRLAEVERNWPLGLHDGPSLADIAEAERSINGCERLLKRLNGEP